MRTLILLMTLLVACNAPPSQEDLDSTRGGRIDVFFNEPGTRITNKWDPDLVDVLVDLIDSADATLDIAVMGFSKSEVIDALIRAYDRGVMVRMVGDAGHWYAPGYHAVLERHIPLVTGNLTHIMHDKFVVVDDRFVFCGTANFTTSDLTQNSNNVMLIDSPAVAADFTAEFEQMFDGAFGHTKVEIDNGRFYQVGDCSDPTNWECTGVEVWFSPNEDAMGRILELVDGAQESIRFTIFAFTKDQVGSAYIRKQEEWTRENIAAGLEEADFRDRKSIAGMIDKSQMHSNGQYHEVYRLLGAGVTMRMDGNDNERFPGDYNFSGGRLHSKTMVLDAYGDNPLVISGSFNWSASATISNDEFALVMHGPRIAQEYDDYFERLWSNGRRFGIDRVDCGGEEICTPVEPGDVVINEVHWYGHHDDDPDGFDEFIELRNTTDHPIHLDMWQITNADDVVVGLPPGSTIPPRSTFTIVDHVWEPYQDGLPQDEQTAFLTGDLILNSFNDNRQARLYLKDGALELFLRDPDAVILDVAGNGGPAFVGGPDSGGRVRSMERNDEPGDGSLPEAWHACTEGGGDVNPAYAATIIATPGADNSPAGN